MIKSNEDLEAYLNRLERRFERVDDGTYLIPMGPQAPPAALRLAPPVLVAQVVIGPAPTVAENSAPLFRRLLEFNAECLVHAAYGIERDTIVLSAALELDNLDINEIEAVLADLDMALAEQVPAIRKVVAQSQIGLTNA
jgi:hypothetical protein